jgi:hypothetical protein
LATLGVFLVVLQYPLVELLHLTNVNIQSIELSEQFLEDIAAASEFLVLAVPLSHKKGTKGGARGVDVLQVIEQPCRIVSWAKRKNHAIPIARVVMVSRNQGAKPTSSWL